MVAFYADLSYQECFASERVGRVGAFMINEYDGCERTGFRVRLAGVVPAGVDRVRLILDGRTIARPAVKDGAWAARAPYPDRISYGDRSVRTESAC